MTDQPVGPRCGNNPNAQLTDGDQKVVDEFRVFLADRAALRQRIADAMRPHYHCIDDADPEADVPCRCGWIDPGPDATHETDWDAHIADVVLKVLPTPVSRADVLRDFLWRLEQSAGDAAAEKLLDDNPELRRLVAEEPQS